MNQDKFHHILLDAKIEDNTAEVDGLLANLGDREFANLLENAVDARVARMQENAFREGIKYARRTLKKIEAELAR